MIFPIARFPGSIEESENATGTHFLMGSPVWRLYLEMGFRNWLPRGEGWRLVEYPMGGVIRKLISVAIRKLVNFLQPFLPEFLFTLLNTALSAAPQISLCRRVRLRRLNPGLLLLCHWQSDARSTRLYLIHDSATSHLWN